MYRLFTPAPPPAAFGFQWYVATHIKDMTPEELQAAAKEQAQ